MGWCHNRVAPETDSERAALLGQFARVDLHLSVPDRALQLPKMLAQARAKNAEAALRFEQGAVSGAAQQAAVAVHELIIVPIQRNSEVRATIQVGMDASIEGADNDDPVIACKETSGFPLDQLIHLAQHHARFSSAQCLGKICKQVVAIFDANGQAHH